MRSIWLASAALILGAGAACAQTVPSPPPAAPASMPAPPPGNWTHGPLPQDAPPEVYLQIAKAALAKHNAARADDALGHAETRLLTRTVIQGPSIPQDEFPRRLRHRTGAPSPEGP